MQINVLLWGGNIQNIMWQTSVLLQDMHRKIIQFSYSDKTNQCINTWHDVVVPVKQSRIFFLAFVKNIYDINFFSKWAYLKLEVFLKPKRR